MNLTDPVYLRTIYDGLLSGNFHKDNASSLPIGLIGIYEDAIPSANHINERQKFLEFFSTWALIRKEVSIKFVAALLDWPEEQALFYIAQYSKWFNAPVSGKYLLYHERLRSFILQKISQTHLLKLNEAIIRMGQDALKLRQGDEWEQYSLEYLSSHLLIQAMHSGMADALKELAYNINHWNRQLEISKGFEWSKRMLNDMMLWASKFDEDEVIECALNKVDLYHQEQNDAPRIVELVAQNDIDTALQRIEAFGGNDKEGLQRKFILYMLCLMELTLLGSKDKSFRKDAIEKLLKHLDDNLPVDHSVLNWNDFFPSNLVFHMACEWVALDLEYINIFKRTEVWETNWLAHIGTPDILQLSILENLANEIDAEEYYKNKLLEIVCRLHARNLNFNKALEIAGGIDSRPIRNSGLWYTFGQMAVKSDLNKTIYLVNEIEDSQEICFAYLEIISRLIVEGNKADAETLLLDVRKRADEMEVDSERGEVLAQISTEYLKLGNQIQSNVCMGQACKIASGFDDEYDADSLFKFIALQFCSQHNFIGAIELIKNMSDESMIASTQKSISVQLAENEKIEDAIVLADAIEDDWEKSSAFSGIAASIAEMGKFKRAMDITQMIEEESDLSAASKKIAIQYVKFDQLDNAMEIASKFDEDWEAEALRDFASEWATGLKFGQIEKLYITKLKYTKGKKSAGFRNKMLDHVINGFASFGNLADFMATTMFIKTDIERIEIYLSGADMFYELGKIDCVTEIIEQAYLTALNIDDDYDKAATLISLYAKVVRYNLLSTYQTIRDESIKISGYIDDVYWASIVLKKIAFELINSEDLNYAEKIIERITEDSIRAEAMVEYANKLIERSEISDAESLLEKTIKIATNLEFDSDKVPLLVMISGAYGKYGNKQKSESIINELQIEFPRSACKVMLKNASSLISLGRVEEAFELYENSIKNANNIKDLKDKSYAFCDIVEYHLQLGNFSQAQIFSTAIPLFDEKLRCWNQIANFAVNNYGYFESLDYVGKLNSNDSKNIYLKSWVDSIEPHQLTKIITLRSCFYLKDDISSLEKLLLIHSLHELFFNNATFEQTNHFNKTLNIQWSIDLKNAINPS